MVEAIRSYHARRGRLSPRQRDALTRLAHLDLAQHPDPLDLDDVFGRRAPHLLEIGSGLGDTAISLALARPDVDHVAADVHSKGIARTLLLAEQHGLANLRVLHGDAWHFTTTRLADASIDTMLVLFPDPWPKSRHAKRRLVRDEFAEAVVRVMRPGGVLHLATDVSQYAQVMRDVLARHPELVCVHDGPRFADRPVTKYEATGLRQGRHAVDLVYRLQTAGRSGDDGWN